MSIRPLKSWRWSWIVAANRDEDLRVGVVELVQPHEVDREAGLDGRPSCPGRRG